MVKYIIIIPIAGILTVAILFFILFLLIKFSDKYIKDSKENKSKKTS